MINPNQRVQGPFGDIFTPNTAATDRAAQMLYIEQKHREARQQAQNAALDEEFSKNLSGIRDADIPELTKAYGDWKLANQQAMKQKNGVPPEQQLQILKKKADLYSVINSSKQRKQYEDETGKGIVSNPDVFEDDAQVQLINHRRTPLSLLTATGQDKYDYRYKGTNTDFQKMLSAAAGQVKQSRAKESPVDKDGLQTKVTPVMYGNTPLQFKESLLSSLSLRKSGRDAAAIIAQTPVEVIAQVNEKFKAIPLERWQDMGVDKPQELIIKGDEIPAERFAIHQAQLYALNNEPKEGTPIYRTNEAVKMAKEATLKKEADARDFAQAKELAGIKFGYAKALKNYSAGKDKVQDENVLNEFINNMQASGTGEIAEVTVNGQKYKGKVVDVPKEIKDKYTVEYKDKETSNEKPDRWYLTDDKKKIIPVFFKKDKNGVPIQANGKYAIKQNDNSTPIDIQNFKVDLGKLLVTQKNRGAEAIDQFEDEAPVTQKGKYD